MAVRRWLSGSATHTLIGAAAVLIAAAASFVLVRATDGTPTPFNHLGYASILLAAYLFGWRGGLAAGALVAVLLGPAATLLSLPGGLEGPDAWLVRGLFYVAVGGVSGELFDRFRSAAATVAARERELAAIIDGASDALLVADDERRYVAANPAACQLFGLEHEQLIGKRIDDFAPGINQRDVAAAWKHFIETGSQRGEMVLVRPDGRQITVEFAATARHIPGRHLSILRDVTERKETEAQLRHLALFDPLTELPNSTLLRDRLRLAIRQAGQAGSEVALVHLGMNGFKAMNDALGRTAGDHVLRIVSQRVLAVAREGDSVARPAGDEFVVVLGHPTDAERAWETAGRILVAIAEPIEHPEGGNRTITLEASAGIGVFPSDASDEVGLLRAADLAMHTAKRRGEGITLYTAEQDEQARQRWARLTELRGALRSDELLLHYQPIFRATDLEPLSVEALVRWQHLSDGLLAPDEFVPLAERSGLINDLALWVLRAAIRQALLWNQAGRRLVTAVNLSPFNLRDSSVVEQLASLLATTRLDPALFKIEITETAIMSADGRAMEGLAGLRTLGMRVAIDDFGTGYSSLGSLRSLPVDELKIDRSFIGRMSQQPADRRIVGSIIELAHYLGLEVTGEGVEDRETLTLLQEMRCDAIQGYFTGPPMPADQIARSALVAA